MNVSDRLRIVQVISVISQDRMNKDERTKAAEVEDRISCQYDGEGVQVIFLRDSYLAYMCFKNIFLVLGKDLKIKAVYFSTSGCDAA